MFKEDGMPVINDLGSCRKVVARASEDSWMAQPSSPDRVREERPRCFYGITNLADWVIGRQLPV